MSESEVFILKAEQFNQEEWCEMFRRVSETCKDLRVENERLRNQLQQKEKIIKEVREKLLCYGESFDNKIHQQMQKELLEILDKENI